MRTALSSRPSSSTEWLHATVSACVSALFEGQTAQSNVDLNELLAATAGNVFVLSASKNGVSSTASVCVIEEQGQRLVVSALHFKDHDFRFRSD